MRYDSLYSKVGIYKIAHFLQPPIIKSDTFIFPDDSTFYFFKPDTKVEFISRDILYLNKTKKATVINIVKYSKDTDGEFKKSDRLDDLINMAIKEEKRFKFLPPGVINNKDPFVIYNYGLINNVFDYKPDVANSYYQYTNTFKRMLEDLKNLANRSRFILFDLPSKMLTMDELDTFSKNLTVGNMRKMTYKHFMLIELWKWLTPDYKDSSLFNGIMNSKLQDTTLLITSANRTMLLNLNILYTIIEEYTNSKYSVNREANDEYIQKLLNTLTGTVNTESLTIKDKQYPSEVIRYLVYIMLFQFSNTAPLDINKLESQQVEDMRIAKAMKLAKKIETSNKLSVSKVLDDYVMDTQEEVVDVGLDTDLEIDFDISSIEAKEADIKAKVNKTFNSIEELKQYDDHADLKTKTVSELNYLLDNKLISKASYNKYIEAFNKQSKLDNPFLDQGQHESIDSLLDRSLDDFGIKDTDGAIASSAIIFDEAINKDINSTIEKKYLREQYRKDIVRCVYSLQNLNNVILSYDVDNKIDIMGGTEEHIVEIMNIAGKKVKLAFEIPYIDETGTFMLYGQPYLLRKQRVDLNIKKISPTTVMLNSYYGKLYLEKARGNSNKIGVWFRRQLEKKFDKRKTEYDPEISNLTLMGSNTPEVNLPVLYAQIGEEIKSFSYKGVHYYFNYSNRLDITEEYTEEEIIKIESNNLVLIGSKGKTLYFMDFTNTIFKYNGNLVETGGIYDVLNISTSSIPIEFVEIKLLKKMVPIVILLGYYLGLDNLINLLKVKVARYDTGKRVTLTDQQYTIRFKDTKLVIDKDNGIGDLILGGLLKQDEILKDTLYNDLNVTKNYVKFLHRFFKMESSVRYTTEIKFLESMYIDPMTENILKAYKEPTNFVGLLVRAVELLKDNNYKHPNSLTNMTLKGYERIAGFIYKELIYALKDYENKSAFSNARLTIDKFAILNKINQDNTKVPIDDLNPIATIKQKEDVSYLGDGGRNKLTMVKKTRELHESEIGVISEATKDSANVGITAYLSSTPNINNISGIIDDNKDQALGWQNILSTTGMLSPFGTTDESKRLRT